MTDYLNYFSLGMGNGAVFAALAIALVVTYRSSGVLNFATGAMALHAAYVYAFLRKGELFIGIPPFANVALGGPMAFIPAVLVTLAVEAVLGLALYAIVFRPLRNSLPVAKAVASIGVMLLMTAAIADRAGDRQIVVAPIFPTETYTWFGVRVVGDRLWFAVTIVAVALALAAFFRFTRFGLATRAAAESSVGAQVSGLSPERIATVNWAISAMVGGLAGILISPLTPLTPGTYTLFIVPALAAAVLGQFSAITPAVIGGLAIGGLQSMVVFLKSRYELIPESGAADLIPLVLVLGALIVRGRPLPTRGTLVQQTLGRAPRPRSVLLPLAICVPAGVALLFVLQGSIRGALITSLILGVISLSLVVVSGYVGQISLAQLTLAGVAGFLLSTIGGSWGVPFPIAPILAAVGATVVGVVVGLPALRIRGLLVGIVTLTLAVTVEALWFRNNDFNGGSAGASIPNPELFGIDLGIGAGESYPRPAFGLLCLAVLVLAAVGVARLRTSRLGSAMLAVKANERSAAASGISVVRTKLIGFAVGAFIAGIGGTLLAYKQTNVTFESFSVLVGLTLFATAYLAGITSISGGVLAGIIGASGIFFVVVDRSIDIGPWYAIIAAVGVIFTVIQNPEGIVGPFHAKLDQRRQASAVLPVAPAGVATAADAVAAAPGGSLRSPAPGPASNGSAPLDGDRGAEPPILVVRSLTVRYGGVVALDDVSLEVPAGTIVGVIGPNGAGKTTMIDALGGFADHTGSVTLAGHRLDGLRPHHRAHLGLGRTFQGIDLYDDLTVAENVVVGEYVDAAGTDGDRDGDGMSHLDRVLANLDLLPHRDRNVSELSQGQRQMVSIARALAGRPRLLLLDEPAAGLDTNESHLLARRLRRVCDEHGITIVLVDHDMSLVLSVCDSIHVLDFGRLIASGTPDEIRASARVAEAYLGTTHVEVAR